MNKRVKIIIDSTTDLPQQIKEQLTVIPLTLRFGDEEYQDGVNITQETFYHKLAITDSLPTTSQATPDAFANVYEQLKANGETAVVITISSLLSGTYQSATIAAEDYADTVFVVDARNATIGTGILTELALALAEQGLTMREIGERLIEARKRVRLVAAFDTLEYLKKGGRISAAEAFAGGVLSIKPIMAVQGGKVVAIGKARGLRQANQTLLREIEKAGGIDFSMPFRFGYTGLEAESVQKFIDDNADYWEMSKVREPAQIGSVIGTHAGPGAYAVAFFAKHE